MITKTKLGLLVLAASVLATPVLAQKYKTAIPPSITTPDRVVIQTRALLETDQRYPSISSQRGVQANPDGSYDIYFGPKSPEGKESNWIQTIPGKGWNVILRFYGPLKPWFDRTWQPGDIELID